MWNLKRWHKGTYLQNRNQVIDIENNSVVNRGGREGEINWKMGLMYTHFYI